MTTSRATRKTPAAGSRAKSAPRKPAAKRPAKSAGPKPNLKSVPDAPDVSGAPHVPPLDIEPDSPQAQALQQLLLNAIFWKQKYFELKQHTDAVINMLSGVQQQPPGIFQAPAAPVAPNGPQGGAQPQQPIVPNGAPG